MSANTTDISLQSHAGPLPAANARLGVTTFCHTAIDFFSFTVPPLLSVLEGHLHLTPGQGALLLGVGGLCNGLVQPLVAWLSDKTNTRIWGWLGLALAVISIGLIGYAKTYEHLMLIQIVSGIGAGAFHPIAAAAVGHLASSRRSFGVAMFYCAGMAGGIAGNVTAPYWVGHFGEQSVGAGLRSIAWLIPPGLGLTAALFWAIHHMPHRHASAHSDHAALSVQERRRRWRSIGVLYAGNVLRFTADTAIILLITRWCEQAILAKAGASVLTDVMRQDAAQLSGPMQAAKQLGMGVCGLVAGWWITPRFEKTALVLSPVLAAVAIAAMPHATGAWALGLTLLAGVGYGGLVPLTISLAQRLLAHRTSLASGLMMGGAWSVSSLGAPLAQVALDRFGMFNAFYLTAGVSLLASGVSMALPREREA